MSNTETRPLLIGGGWRTTSATREVRSPYSSELLAHFSVASAAERVTPYPLLMFYNALLFYNALPNVIV